jgi:hypothetical protein
MAPPWATQATLPESTPLRPMAAVQSGLTALRIVPMTGCSTQATGDHAARFLGEQPR